MKEINTTKYTLFWRSIGKKNECAQEDDDGRHPRSCLVSLLDLFVVCVLHCVHSSPAHAKTHDFDYSLTKTTKFTTEDKVWNDIIIRASNRNANRNVGRRTQTRLCTTERFEKAMAEQRRKILYHLCIRQSLVKWPNSDYRLDIGDVHIHGKGTGGLGVCEGDW